MTLEVQTIRSINSALCRCRAHSQHRVYRYLFDHPSSSSLHLVARDLHLSYSAVKMAKSRLHRRKNLNLLCPECFKPSLHGLVCESCGMELDAPSLPDGIRFDETTPVHSIQPLGGLGSDVAYEGGRDAENHWSPMRMQYGGRNISHLTERPADQLLEGCKSMLWEELKSFMPSDIIVEEGSRLVTKEVKEFEMRFPMLRSSKHVRAQLVNNVLSLMKLRYPQLRHGNAVTPVLGAEG